jgi:N-methylhydantoinase B/oxoprolinase/acetone carboxylase alpha subunit
MSCFN